MTYKTAGPPDKENLLLRVNRLFEKFGHFVAKQRVALSLLPVIIIAASAIGLSQLKIGLDLDAYFSEGDPLMETKAAFADKFGNNDFIGVLVDADSVFDRRVLNMIRELSTALREEVPCAKEVISLTDVQYVVPVNPMMPAAEPVYDTRKVEIDSLTDKELAQIQKLFDNREGIKGRLYSADYKQTWIIVRLSDYAGADLKGSKKSAIEVVGQAAYEVTERISSKYQDELAGTGFKLTATGSPVIAYRRNAESFGEMVKIVSAAAAIAVLLIVFLTRSARATIGVIATIAGALAIVLGIQGHLGRTLDSAFMLIPILLTIAVAVAYATHFTTIYNKIFSETGDRKLAVAYSMKKNGWPIFFASFTTIVSLSSFMLVPIAPIQWAGAASSASIAAVYLLLMTFYPALLSMGAGQAPKAPSGAEPLWDRFLGKLAAFALSRRALILGTAAASTLVMLALSSKVEVSLHPKRMFGTAMHHAKDMVYVSESKIATNYSYNILLDGREPGFFRQLENAQKLQAAKASVLSDSIASSASSLADRASEINQALRGDNPRFCRLPATQNGYESIISKLEELIPGQARNWVTADYSAAQIFVELPDFDSKTFVPHIERLKTSIDSIFAEGAGSQPDFKASYTGYAIQFSQMNQYVTYGLLVSFGATLLIVFVLLSIAFGSLKIGFIGMVPNIIPVVFAGGVMGAMGMPLEFVTMTIAPMVIGLAVDNTVHLMNYIRLERLGGKSYDEAITISFATIGQALIKSSVILCCTLATFGFAKMANMVNMGILTVVAIAAATLTDLLVTPNLIRLTKPFGKK
jgi:uncharacterized protein